MSSGDPAAASLPGDDERGSEVDDYTGQIPRIDTDATASDDAGMPTGFGDGDVADVSDDGSDGGPEGGPGGGADGDLDERFDALVDGLDVEGVDVQDADTPDGDTQDVDIAALAAERDRFRDAAMRVQADFENFRKRTASQAADDVDRATGRLAEAFLPVLDAAEAAYVQHPDEVGPLLNVMLAELRKHGLETLDLHSAPFDPEVAEAVAHEPGDGGDVIVAEVLRSGYRWRGKTLRPAMVRTKD